MFFNLRTLFEHILRNETPLMFNHHLDQVVYCVNRLFFKLIIRI